MLQPNQNQHAGLGGEVAEAGRALLELALAGEGALLREAAGEVRMYAQDGSSDWNYL